MRVESARATVISAPLSVVNTTELPLIDFTVPTAFASAVCAIAAHPNIRKAAHFKAIALCADNGFGRTFFIDTLMIIQSCDRIKVGKELSNPGKRKAMRRGYNGHLRVRIQSSLMGGGFDFEQRLFALQTPAISTKIAVGAKHAVAGDRNRHRVRGARPRNRANG